MRPFTWILTFMLLLAPSLAPAAHPVLVKAEALTLRDKPSKSGNTLDKLTAFQPVDLLKTDGDWAQVKTAKNQTGYVLADYLTPSAFVYTGEDKVNGRRGYGTQYDIMIVYEQPNMPLRVLDATDDGWLMVMDYEGDRSWVYSKNVNTSGRYVITKEPNCNVRKGVGIGQDLVFTAQKGVILKVIEEKDGWLHVKHTDGDEGWLSAKTVFGWLDVDAPASGKSAAEDSKGSGKASSSKSGSDKASTASKSGSKSGSSDDEGAASSKSSTKKKSTGSSARRTKRSSSADDDEDSGSTSKKSSTRRTKRSSSADDEDSGSSSKTSTRASAAKAGSTRAVSLRSGSKSSDSESAGSAKTSARRTRSRKAASKSAE